MQPVLEGLITYDKLLDPALGLSDIARMNDAIAVRQENQRRFEAAARQGQ
ncbi:MULTISPECIES: hypothetical protein [unclassified Novosphingobium]|nr:MULTISPECIES: hypothetical protein [unclassified Novosphingobium]